MKKLISGLLAVVGLSANAEKAVEKVNPNDILYSMPTISGDKIDFQIPTEESFEGAPQFHEDDWCQLEFYPTSRLSEIQKQLTQYKLFESKNRVASGWKNIFIRENARSKFEFGSELLASLLNAIKASSPILTTSSKPLGQVKHGFTINLGDGAFLYGIEQDNKVISIGATVYSDAGNQLLTNAYTAISKSNELVLVDWRAQMIMVGSSNGKMQVWKP